MKISDSMQKRVLLSERNTLPKTPGVYFFLGKNDTVLYIGKATNLRSRVSQYFSGRDSRGERIRIMVEKSEHLSYVAVDTVLEAVILEANSIKKYQPRYNVDLRDDKSFSFIAITKDEFPRFVFVREKELMLYQKGKKTRWSLNGKETPFSRVYGPYTSKKQAESVLKTLRRIFPFHAVKSMSEKGCLHFQIGLCPGPYEGIISKKAYLCHIRNIEYVLRGQKKRLLTTLEKEMNMLSKKGAYEEALKKRNEITAVRHIRDVALLSRESGLFSDGGEGDISKKGYRLEAYDISHISGESPVASLVVFEGSVAKKSDYKKFHIHSVKGVDDYAMMREVLARRLRHEEWGRPDAIVLDGGLGHLHMAEELWEVLGQDIPLLAVAKGPTRKKVDMYLSLKFPPNKELCNPELLEKMREEAHRFAISFHRKTRGKLFSQKKKTS